MGKLNLSEFRKAGKLNRTSRQPVLNPIFTNYFILFFSAFTLLLKNTLSISCTFCSSCPVFSREVLVLWPMGP